MAENDTTPPDDDTPTLDSDAADATKASHASSDEQPTVQSGGGGGGGTPRPRRTPAAAHPTQVDRYRILDVLGEGGMGTVYRAEQREPVKRIVALKLVKLGMDTKAVLARFEAERQALAMMDHPCIAKVLDAGSTETGRPYFVMEYVPGESITRYCDKHQLTTRERLELFVDVLDAIQHAHTKGIIHRDLKPSNVLVAVSDNRAVPKIIDFGVAKATSQRLTENTFFTEHGQIIGTPE
ncbi:MAG: serine/threonine-protein kinase, partial [Phycisphaerae bacterium]